jgi:hypothetical protein
LNELYNDVLRTSEIILASEEQYKNIECQVCKVLSHTISGKGKLRKSPKKSSWWFVSRARLCHEHKMSASTNNFFFVKKQWTKKAWNVQYNIWLLSFEPGLNPNIICAHRPSPWAGSGRGPGPCTPLQHRTPSNKIRWHYVACELSVITTVISLQINWTPVYL